MKYYNLRDLMIYVKKIYDTNHTRGQQRKNTLDLVYTNDIRIVTNIDVNTLVISDHIKIEIPTTYRIIEEKINKKKAGCG